jgi:hypothetical protein
MSTNYRDSSDDAAHLQYSTLAAAYLAVVQQLPRVDGRSLYIQVDNEPDLVRPAMPPSTLIGAILSIYSYSICSLHLLLCSPPSQLLIVVL